MGSEWIDTTLGEFADLKTGLPFASKDFIEEGSGTRLLRGDNIVQGSFRWANVKLWPNELLTEKQKSYHLELDDVILAMDRPWIEAGLKTGQISDTDLPCLLVQRVARLKAIEPDDQDYLRYLISSYWFVEYVKLVQTGTAVPHISPGQIKSYQFRKPPKKDRIKIGELMRSLDNKIQLNRQINQTLEAMAQALFKSWFVDFDPVIDNALAAGNAIPDALAARAEQRRAVLAAALAAAHDGGSTPSADDAVPVLLPESTRALFPDAFVLDAEMGWVPEGWECCSLLDVIELIGGGTPKTSIAEYWDGEIPWYSVADAPNDSDVFVINTEKHISNSGLANSSTKLLRAGTTIISARGTVGKCAIAGCPMTMNQSCYAVTGKDGVSDEFVYYSVRGQVTGLQQRSHGSVFSTITRDTFKSIKVAFPGTGATQLYSASVQPLFQKLVMNLENITILEKTRDVLLPKLISGELRLSDDQ